MAKKYFRIFYDYDENLTSEEISRKAYKLGKERNYDDMDPDEESEVDYIDEDDLRYIMSMATVGTFKKGVVYLEKVKDTVILRSDLGIMAREGKFLLVNGCEYGVPLGEEGQETKGIAPMLEEVLGYEVAEELEPYMCGLRKQSVWRDCITWDNYNKLSDEMKSRLDKALEENFGSMFLKFDKDMIIFGFLEHI